MNAGLILIGTFFLLLVLNVPIAWSIGMAVVLYIVTSGTFSISYVATTMFTACDSFPLMAIPLFILAGALMEGGGLSQRLIDFADSLVGHKRGGLAIVTVLACMFFGAISGSSAATVATIGVIMVPSMIKQGYSKGFSYALIAAAGVLGVLIPPSIPFVTYGVATNASIATMFMGGFGPGILCGCLLIVVSQIICRKNGWEGNGKQFSWKRVGDSFRSAIGALLVPVIILGGIYGGICTPTEAAVVACFYALIVGLFIYKEIKFSQLFSIFSRSALTSGTCLILLGGAQAFGRILTLEQVPQTITHFINSFTDSKIVVLLLINILLFIVGMFMETLAAVTILAPILLAVVEPMGVNPLHFGIIISMNLTIGMCTPPVGCNLFIAAGKAKCSLESMIKYLIPCLIALLVVLLFCTYCEPFVLFLPNLLKG